MSKSSTSLLNREFEAMVRSGLFNDKAAALREVLGTFFAAKPQYRVEAALEMLRSGEVTLSRAAEIAGINVCRFRELWLHRGGSEENEVDAADVADQANRIARRRS